VGAYLSFTTGKLISAKPNEWTFGGGTIAITGCVDWNGDWNRDHAKGCDRRDYRGAILTGTFLDAMVVNEGNGLKTLQASILYEINPSLAQFLGLPVGRLSRGEFDLGIRRTRILSGYLNGPSVPEPSSLPLLGSGLALMGMFRLRKSRLSRTQESGRH